MNKIILFGMSFFAANMAWAQQASTAAPSGSTETVNADSVPIEEYVPKVIIEGKWGTVSGEFGMASRFPLGLYDQYVPSSLAVDSKGNIYVLDFVNNRIQKFNKDGQYLTFLPIEGLKGELAGYCAGDTCYEVPPAPGVKYDRPVIRGIEAIGINIVIDSKDTLHYYLKRIKDKKETGEVWEFKNDKFVEKTVFSNKESLPAKFKLYQVSDNEQAMGMVEPSSRGLVSKYRINIKKEKENFLVDVQDNSGKRVSEISIIPAATYSTEKGKYSRTKSDVYFDKILDNGNFRIRTVEGTINNIATEEREYTPEGKLVRRIKSPPGYSHGIEVGAAGVKVVRWVIQKSN